VVWIGYIQWLHDNGFGIPEDPILKPLHNIRHMDAVLAYDEAGHPVEPAWPAADVIIGNPPFLGGSKLRRELGDAYAERVWALYGGRVAGGADLVCYWFERARALIERGDAQRAGLLATNSIRGGANRRVLDRIKVSGDIFMAWGDRPWVLDGAAVRVSMIGFDGGQERERILDGRDVAAINADLSAQADVRGAPALRENADLCFRSDEKGGPFDITAEIARPMLDAPLNPNGHPNSDVVRPYVNGLDVTRRPRGMWVIDFGVDMPLEEAALYEQPFAYVQRTVKPARDAVRSDRERAYWWLHRRAAPDMRRAVARLARFVATPAVAKHRIFVWCDGATIPDHQLYVFAREDDYFLGVLHARPHELWTLRTCTWLGVGNDPRYTPTTTFETFPFPWVPGTEPTGDPRVDAIAAAARALVEQRDRWLNPDGATDADLKARTLTALYNARPTWLDLAHRRLDDAVLDAYAWPRDLGDEEILGQLLALNLERAAVLDQGTLVGVVTSEERSRDSGGTI